MVLIKNVLSTAGQKSLPQGVPADSMGPVGKHSVGPKRETPWAPCIGQWTLAGSLCLEGCSGSHPGPGLGMAGNTA